MRQFMTGRRERRKRQREERKRKSQESEVSMLGKIIDLSLEDFKAELVRQQVNIGTMNNLILNLEGAYNELRMRKDALLKMNFEGSVDREKAQDSIKGLYAEMIKVEEKIVYLKDRVTELINVD